MTTDDATRQSPLNLLEEVTYHLLLAVMLTSFVIDALAVGGVVLKVLFLAVVTGSLVIVLRRRRLLLIALLIVLPGTALTLTAEEDNPWMLAARTAALVFLAAIVARDVYTSDEVTPATISGALFVYLLIGAIWAQLYHLTEVLNPGSFSGIATDSPPEALSAFRYFSFVTLTTVGYGDVSPVSAAARSLAVLEAIVGQLYLVAAVARLVGLMSRRATGAGSSR